MRTAERWPRGEYSDTSFEMTKKPKERQNMDRKLESFAGSFSQKISEAMAPISEIIQNYADEHGPNSPQMGDGYLRLHRMRFLPDQSAYVKFSDEEYSRDVISRGITSDFEDTMLGLYIQHDLSQKEHRLETVESILINSLNEWTNAAPENVRQALFALLDLAAYWRILGNAARSRVLIERVVGLCHEYLDPTDAVLVRAFIDMSADHEQGDSDKAERVLKKALEICEANPEAMDCYGARVLMNLAAIANSQDQLPFVIWYLDRALEVADRVSEPDRSQILELLCYQARLYSLLDQRERFDDLAVRALKEAKEYWKRDPDFATECMMSLFGLYQLQGRFDEARAISKTLVDLKGIGIPANTIQTRSN